jgi:retron-type reverse transcriptase
MRWASLISMPNLRLAWRRINTGRNLQHKRFFREAYLVYEASLDQNLKALRQALLKKAWQPTHGRRIYLPKPSGLQRPLTLLGIEDQILFQAFANRVAKKIRKKRQKVELVSVFSNQLSTPENSIFFTEQWQHTYRKFQEKCRGLFTDGYCWAADFDLAAYYDTISHNVLKQIVSPRINNNLIWNQVGEWLQTWSAVNSDSMKNHGIPQGPIASDFLAEAFFLPIDLKMMKRAITYIRYVDDIRLFGKTENEVRQAAIVLEQLCRERGLIPHNSKCCIRKLKTTEDAMGSLPSIPSTDGRQPNDVGMPIEQARQMLVSALNGKHSQVADKSRFRFILYRAPEDTVILRHVVRLLPRHPEHIDAFMAYLGNYTKSHRITKAAIKYLQSEVPYTYLRGELYHLLARIGTLADLQQALPLARNDACRRNDCAALSWGVMHFLIRCEKEGLSAIGRRLNAEIPFSRALLAPVLPDKVFSRALIIEQMLKGTVEEQLTAAREMQKRKITLKNLGLNQRQIGHQACRSLRALGVIRRRLRQDIDWISDRLVKRYDIYARPVWRTLLEVEYEHALQILIEAEAAFDQARSHWLSLQDSFNDILVRQLFAYLASRGMAGHTKTKGRDGKLVNFGILLQASTPFDVEYPTEAALLRDVHERRNQLPGSHPYDKKGGAQNHFLKKAEQKSLVTKLRRIYTGITKIIK